MPQDSMTRRNKKFLLCFSMQSGVIIYTSIIFSVVTCSFFSNLTAEQRYSHGPPMKYAYGILLVYSFSNLFGLLFLSTGAFLLNRRIFKLGLYVVFSLTIFWAAISILSLIPVPVTYEFVCIDGRCPPTHWLIDSRFRMFFNDCNKPDEGGLAVKMLPRSESHQVSPSKENPVNRDIIDSASHSTSMSTESPTMNIPTTASYSPASTRPLHNTSTSMPPHNGIAPNFNADAMQESNEKVFSIKSKQTTEEDILTDAVSKRLEHVHGLELSQTESQELPKTTSPVSDQLLDLKHSSDVFQYKGTSEIPYIEQSDHNVTLMTPNSTTTSTKNLTIMEDLSIWGTQAGLLGRYENRTEDGGNTQPFSIYSIQPSSWSTLEGMPLNIMLIPTKGTQKPTEVSFQVNNLEQSTSTSSSLTTENMLKETTALFKKFVWNTESMARTTSDPLPIPVRKTESGIPVKQFSPAHRYIQLTANPLRSWSVVHKLIAEYSNESRKSGLRKQQLTKVMFQAMYMVDKKQCNIYNIEMIMETILTLLYAGFSIYGLVNSYAFLKSVTHR